MATIKATQVNIIDPSQTYNAVTKSNMETYITNNVNYLAPMTMRADGILRTITGVDPIVVTLTKTINKIVVLRVDAGTSGSLIIDVNKNGTTLFTNQAHRPTIPASSGDNVIVEVVPDVTSLTEDDIITFDIDQVESGNSQHVIVEIV